MAIKKFIEDDQATLKIAQREVFFGRLFIFTSQKISYALLDDSNMRIWSICSSLPEREGDFTLFLSLLTAVFLIILSHSRVVKFVRLFLRKLPGNYSELWNSCIRFEWPLSEVPLISLSAQNDSPRCKARERSLLARTRRCQALRLRLCPALCCHQRREVHW